ncbi:MAG TPA: response regulator [Planctomycetota bacterium]|nr:response regulator [Planctomycetota bacterium]
MENEPRPKSILICDDEPDILEMMSNLFKSKGYAVETATGHEEFFAKFERNRPDLILLDIRIPDRDGFSIADELQQRENRAPIIFVTAHNRSIYRLCSPVAGAVDFIVKPFDPDVLLASVKKALKSDASGSNWFLYATCRKSQLAEQSTE